MNSELEAIQHYFAYRKHDPNQEPALPPKKHPRVVKVVVDGKEVEKIIMSRRNLRPATGVVIQNFSKGDDDRVMNHVWGDPVPEKQPKEIRLFWRKTCGGATTWRRCGNGETLHFQGKRYTVPFILWVLRHGRLPEHGVVHEQQRPEIRSFKDLHEAALPGNSHIWFDKDISLYRAAVRFNGMLYIEMFQSLDNAAAWVSSIPRPRKPRAKPPGNVTIVNGKWMAQLTFNRKRHAKWFDDKDTARQWLDATYISLTSLPPNPERVAVSDDDNL